MQIINDIIIRKAILLTKVMFDPIRGLEISEYIDSIYYADLFNIKGKIWMITV